MCENVTFAPGDAIFEYGQRMAGMIIIEKGRVVTLDPDTHEILVCSIFSWVKTGFDQVMSRNTK